MPTTMTIKTVVTAGDLLAIQHELTHSIQTVTIKNESIPESSTDLEMLLAIDISEMKCFVMISDVAMTVETNSGGSPQETFTLAADTPVIWNDGDAAIFAGDITGFYATTGVVGVGTLQIAVGVA